MQHGYRTVEDLLKDDSFISYCLKKNEQDVRYWETYIAENPGKRELIAEAVQEYQLLFSALAKADMDEQLENLKKRLEGSDEAPVFVLDRAAKRRFGLARRPAFGVAAAVVLLVIGSYFFWKALPVTKPAAGAIRYNCNQGERKSFQFPDGTQVILNAASEILLDDHFGRRTREVFLKGEAFFEVQHNAAVPFIVHTASMDVKALGTAFNVKSYNNENKTEAVLIRGLVEVTLKKDNNRKLLLHPDEKVLWREEYTTTAPKASTAVNKNTSQQTTIEQVKKLDNGSIKELAWVQNDLAFDDETFEEIAYQLNRWYNVTIQFEKDDIKQYHFTATFKKEKIEQVMDILKTSKKFNYRFEANRTIVISK